MSIAADRAATKTGDGPLAEPAVPPALDPPRSPRTFPKSRARARTWRTSHLTFACVRRDMRRTTGKPAHPRVLASSRLSTMALQRTTAMMPNPTLLSPPRPTPPPGQRLGKPAVCLATLLTVMVLMQPSFGTAARAQTAPPVAGQPSASSFARPGDAAGTARAHQFKLANGMEVVVIPDHRAPVVTHMVWYRVGAADEPRGVSGIAHFLEHLMFKSTEKIAIGRVLQDRRRGSAARTTPSPATTPPPTSSASPRTACRRSWRWRPTAW